MKKAFKITGISLLVIILLLVAAPFIFQSQIKDMIKKTINEKLNAQIDKQLYHNANNCITNSVIMKYS